MIVLNKKHMDRLYKLSIENIDFTVSHIRSNIRNKELANVITQKLNWIIIYLNDVYNPELIELKHHADLYYQKWLILKNADSNEAHTVFIEYLKLQDQIREIEIPF